MASQRPPEQQRSSRLSATAMRERVRAHFARRHPEPLLDRPIYIYPGLLRTSPERAVVLDSLCPAAPYAEMNPENGSDDRIASNGVCSLKSGTLGEVCCPICFDDFAPTDLVRTLYCGHQFHSGCLLTWLTKGPAARCPLCQASLSPPYECCMGAVGYGDHGSGNPESTVCSENKNNLSARRNCPCTDDGQRKSTPVVRLPGCEDCRYQTICAVPYKESNCDSSARTYCYLQHDYARFSRRGQL